MKRAVLIVTILFIAVVSTACINNFAVQELNNKAQAFMDQGDYTSAINRLQSSIDLDSTLYETHYNLGVAYVKAEEYSKAIDSLKKAISLKPDYYDSYYSLAIAQEGLAEKMLANENKKDKANTPNVCQVQTPTDSDIDNSLSPEAKKAKAIGLYNDAISSYNTYLENGKNIDDKESITNQIKDDQAEVQKLEK